MCIKTLVTTIPGLLLRKTNLFSVLFVLFLASPSLAANNKNSISFKIGKRRLSFGENQVEINKLNSLGDFRFNFQKQGNNKFAVLQFYFDDIGLSLRKYRIVGPGNYIEKSGDVVAVFAMGEKQSGIGLASQNDSSAIGELVVTKIDKENQTIEADFNFVTNLARTNKKGKVKLQEVKFKQGKINANIAGVGREFF